MKILIMGSGNARSLGRMLSYYGVDVDIIDSIPIIPRKKNADISLVMGVWSAQWLLRMQMLPGRKVYRIQGSDAYKMSSATRNTLRLMMLRGDSILYAADNLTKVVGLPGEVISTPVDTALFYPSEEVTDRSKDVLYYCPKGREATYRINKLYEYLKAYPTEKFTIIDGKVPHKEMPDLYRSHRKYLRWTTHDANPKMPYEALLCGCEVWFNDERITEVPDFMLMENAIPRFISFFEGIY